MAASNDTPAFDLLHEKVRAWIGERRWSGLREIQEQAIPLIVEHRNDLILTASTAGGKTEAAYLPICSVLLEGALEGLQVVSVSPLKALIDDQYDRLRSLCDFLGLPVHRWHGDIKSGDKQRFLDDPQGLLLITPESLEALFIGHGSRVSEWFRATSFLVIDELHAFLNTERGRQLQSLFNRLETAAGRWIPRIGLSATLGDMNLAAAFLRPPRGENVGLLEAKKEGREVKLQVRGYETLDEEIADPKERRARIKAGQACSDRKVAEHLFSVLRGHDNLVFANTRNRVERFSDLLRGMSEAQNVPNEFSAHHGSLDREHRGTVENHLKDRRLPATLVCTSTLEMGIDVGNVRTVAQIGCPASVAAMNQRLGRSGRSEEEPARLRIYVQEHPPVGSSPFPERLRPRLFQTLAMVELLLARWCEPPTPEALHGSTLVHQVLAVIAQCHGIKADKAYEVLCGKGPFRSVTEKMFIQLLRHLGVSDWIVQNDEGLLLLGERGEREVNHYRFYAVFGGSGELRLVHEGRTLGTLPAGYSLRQGMGILFAGKPWKILEVDLKRGEARVAPGQGGRLPVFSGTAFPVHSRVRREMFRLYCSSEVPSYLDAAGQTMLEKGRRRFKESGLEIRMFLEEEKNLRVFPWQGDKIMNSLMLLLLGTGLNLRNQGICLTIK
ncbi:MAG: DEAD/DEAH box helicase, partial [Planctomycetes bacterium]|nr:DEAD/DEAH box helicase [Planctomycetota bacterium]